MKMGSREDEFKKGPVTKEVPVNTYAVLKDDKFHEIATKNGISFGKLKQLNGGTSKLKEGQILKFRD